MSIEQLPAAATAAGRVRRLAADLHPYHLRYERRRDERAVFAYVYYNITLDLADRLEDPKSGFDDPDWVADLALAFGGRFRAAMDALDTWLEANASPHAAALASLYSSVPTPWADVYRATTGGRSYVLEDLVYSMAAHISFDLPYAILEVDHGLERMGDYHRMNEVLANRTEFIQEAVAVRYQRWLKDLDWLAGSFDEFYSNYGIRGARSVAWYNAMRLASPSAAEAAGSISRSTGLLIQAVRNPSEWWMRLAIRAVRLLLPRRRTWPPAPDEPPARSPSRESSRTQRSRW